MPQENKFSISPNLSSENLTPSNGETVAEPNPNNEDGPDVEQIYKKFVQEIEKIYGLYRTARTMSEQITAMVELETLSFHSLLEKFDFKKVVEAISQLQQQKKTAPSIVDLIRNLEPDIHKRRQLLEKILQDARGLDDNLDDKLKQNPEDEKLKEQLKFYNEFYRSPSNYAIIVESQINELMKTDRKIWGNLHKLLLGKNDRFLEIFTTQVIPERDEADRFLEELGKNEGNLFRLLNAREKKRKEILEAIHIEAEQLKKSIEEAFAQALEELNQEHKKFINDLTADIDQLPVEFATEVARTVVMQTSESLKEIKNNKISEHQQKIKEILEKKQYLLNMISSLVTQS